MNIRYMMLVVTVFASALCAQITQNLNNSLTTPQSSRSSGLVPSRQPGIYSSSGGIAGNDIVTGNVSGGKEFRGVVPYGSPAYFQGNQGTSSLNSFLRRSSGSGYATDSSPGHVQSYIDPARAVTGLQAGRPVNSQIYQPMPTNKSGINTYGLVPLEQAQQLAGTNRVTTPKMPAATVPMEYARYRPLTATPQETELMLSDELRGKLTPTEQREAEAEQFTKNLQQVKEQAQLLKEKPSQELQELQQPEIPSELQNPTLPGEKPVQVKEKPPTVFDEMRKRSQDEFRKNMLELGKERAGKGGVEEANVPAPNVRGAFSEVEPGVAKAILGFSKTFAAPSDDNFNTLMRAAESYLKKKQFYKAADAYTLASTYQLDNPLPYGGKSLALLGAGEYMSSAYYLSRAVEIYPDYLRFKIDLLAMLGGDKDLIESRIQEISQWQEKNGSAELLMLLGYVYYETDQLDKAQMAINSAMTKMPESRVLKTLDAVIDRAVEEAKAGE